MRLLIILVLVLMPTFGVAQTIWLPVGGDSTPCKVDFEDFIAFAQGFNSQDGDPNYNARYDVNKDGWINFPDFIAFSAVFGLDVVGPVTKQSNPWFLDRRCYTVPYGVVGKITLGGKPFENVWVDVLDEKKLEVRASKTTDSEGFFDHSNLDNGSYVVVPKRFGYGFTPDTLRAVVEDTLLTLPLVRAALQFGVVAVQVVQDGKPLADVLVSLSRSIAGQQASTPTQGVTDVGGVTVMRVGVDVRQKDIAGYYHVVVSQSGRVLDAWTSVPVEANAGRLVLDVGKEVHYGPEITYRYLDDLEKKEVRLTDANQSLVVWFRDDVNVTKKTELLQELGLIKRGGGFSFRYPKGKLALLEAMHRLKRSGLVKSVVPYVVREPGFFFLRSNHVFVFVKKDTPEIQIEQLLEEIGGTVVANDLSQNSFELKIQKFPYLDVTAFYEHYRNHPLIEKIQLGKTFALYGTTKSVVP